MFVHLRLHSEFSIIDSTLPVPDAIKLAVSKQQPALAITDLDNLFGAISFYKKALASGIKPIIGAEVTIVEDYAQNKFSKLLLLVQNHQGYLNLTELLSQGWLNPKVSSHAIIEPQWLQQHNAGLILLSGAHEGAIGKALLAEDYSSASSLAQDFAQTFKQRFYLEVQRAGRATDETLVQATAKLAAQLQLPLVATHPIQFATESDFAAHEARVCISSGEILANPKRPKNYTPQQYFKSSAEMQQLFADLPSALTNAIEIAKRCNISIELGKPQLPNYPIPDGLTTAEYFSKVSHQGLEQRLLQLFPDAEKREAARPGYVERLEFEINTILDMGFPGYFLIVSDFINWAKNNQCPVGPGRGSGAGSLVAYALNITDLDPLAYNLLFERFLNPERVSMPDFDIDFCQSNRDRVIDYVKDKYGKAAVSQIVTFGTMAARAAIRDVGRVLDFNYNFCDGISKLIPNKPGMAVTLQYPPAEKKPGDKNNYAIEMEPQLAQRIEQEDEVKTLIELAQKLEGLTRNVGMHAGGVLIAPNKLTDFCPLYQQPGSNSTVSQYDKNDVEDAGLVKFDFLGLATLTILERARQLIIKRHPEQKNFDFNAIDLKDKATYRLFAKGKTEAVFQFESQGMQNLLKDAKPSRLEDLIALNALYRPGPMDLIPSFVARKHGREEVEYPHPLVADMLAETYGIMVYQEQVMQTAQLLGGYSLGGADLLRRAMGKKKPEEMAEHRQLFRAGAAEKGIATSKADDIFDLMEKFAGYGFNKSHAAAYSLLAYQTGWLKVHFPVEFYCANMTTEMDNTDKLRSLYKDAMQMGISFAAPDVNLGDYAFEPINDKSIRYGMGAIKGSGEQAIEAIVKARNGTGNGTFGDQNGPFTSLFDFCNRVERGKISKRTVEALIKAGAFDSIEPNRASLLASVDLAFEFAAAQEANSQQMGLFDFSAEAVGCSTQEPQLRPVPLWDTKQRLLQEKTALGFFLSGHLFDDLEAEARLLGAVPQNKVKESSDYILVAGIISEVRLINTSRGKLIFVTLDDKTAQLEIRFDEEMFYNNSQLLKEDEPLMLQISVKKDRFSNSIRMAAKELTSILQERIKKASYFQIKLTEQDFPIQALVSKHAELNPNSADNNKANTVGVRLVIERNGAKAVCQLQRLRIVPTDKVLADWQQCTQGNSQLIYLNS